MWETISSQLVRALRGRRSQRAFAKQLKFKGNPIANWEAGRRFPSAADFFRMLARTGIDVEAVLRTFDKNSYAQAAPYDQEALARWLNILRGATKLDDVARRCGRSRFAVSRWLGNKTQPRLPEFLLLLEAITNRASDFVAQVVPITSVPSLMEEHERRLASRRLAFSMPWTAAVLRILETTSYQSRNHQTGFIAERLGISIETERQALAALESAGVVAQGSERYETRGELTVDVFVEPERITALKHHWALAAADRISQAHPIDRFSYNIFSCSSEDLLRIEKLHYEFFAQVRSIVAASAPNEAVAMLQVSLVKWMA